MTEIEKKALALLNEVQNERDERPYFEIFRDVENEVEALCRAIEQHEAYKQRVSDALLEYYGGYDNASGETLEHFIILKPTVDPLVEALIKGGIVNLGAAEMAADIREALAKRGLKIVEIER